MLTERESEFGNATLLLAWNQSIIPRGLAFRLLTALGGLDAGRPNADLKTLFDARRWFELRETVEAGEAPGFY